MFFNKILAANPPDGFQANVRHVGNFLHDDFGITQPGKVPRGDSKHLSLFERSQPRESSFVIASFQVGLKQLIHFLEQSGWPAGKLQSGRFYDLDQFRFRNKQIAKSLRTAQHCRENSRFFRFIIF